MFHKDKPVDWLMDHILWVKVCNPEKDQVSSYLLFYSEAFTPKHQSIHFLCTVLFTFPMVLTKRISLTIKSIF